MNISSEISINESNFSSCFFSGTDFHVSLAVNIICILLSFPPSSYVIWLIVTGTGNGFAAEFFILNLSVCDILLCVQTLLVILPREYLDAVPTAWIAVCFLVGVFITGPPVFQCLICVERYLAVVHPVTFLKYKPLRYRLMCAAVTWVLVFAYGGISTVAFLFAYGLYIILYVAQFLLFLSIQLFCCLAVLRALKQSGPGERGREREEENHMKRRAFYFILITTVTTVILYVTYFILLFIPTPENVCAVNMYVAQFCFILAGLVQPVLFLYRVGKLNPMKCQ